jgi:hypothetical protein
MLCTLLPPTEGAATVAGVDVIADPAEVRRRIGVVLQEIGLDSSSSSGWSTPPTVALCMFVIVAMGAIITVLSLTAIATNDR